MSKTIKVCPNCDKPVYFQRNKDKKFKCYVCDEWFEQVVERERGTGWDNERKRKTYITDSELITKKELIERIDNLKSKNRHHNLKYQALIAFLYLTAARVEEVVGLIKRVSGETKEQRKVQVRGAEAIRINQITFENLNDEPFMVVNNMPTLKRKLKSKDAYGKEINRIPTRTTGIWIRDDKELASYIKSYIDSLREINPMLPLFKMTYQRAWQISSMIQILPEKNAFNHYWRHLRLSHLAGNYGFTDMQLQQYVGWANTNMAGKYVHLDWRSLGKVMIYGGKKNENNITRI